MKEGGKNKYKWKGNNISNIMVKFYLYEFVDFLCPCLFYSNCNNTHFYPPYLWHILHQG